MRKGASKWVDPGAEEAACREKCRPTIATLRGRGIRIDALLIRCGVSARMLEGFLSGEHRPSPWLARRIAEAAGMSPAEIWPPDSDTEIRVELRRMIEKKWQRKEDLR